MSNEAFSVPDSREEHLDRLFRSLGTLSKLIAQRRAAAGGLQLSSSLNDLVDSVLAELPESEDDCSPSIMAIFRNLSRRISRSLPLPHEEDLEALLQDDIGESARDSEDSNTLAEPEQDITDTATLTNIEDSSTTILAIPSGPSANTVSSPPAPGEPTTGETEAQISGNASATAEVDAPASTDTVKVTGLTSAPDSPGPNSSQQAVKLCAPNGHTETEYMEGNDHKIASGGLDDTLSSGEEKEAPPAQDTGTASLIAHEKTVDEEAGSKDIVQSPMARNDSDTNEEDLVIRSSKLGTADIKAGGLGHQVADVSDEIVSDAVGDGVKAPKPKARIGKKRSRDAPDDKEFGVADWDGLNTKIPKLNSGKTRGDADRSKGNQSRDAQLGATEPRPSVPKPVKTFKELKASLLDYKT